MVLARWDFDFSEGYSKWVCRALLGIYESWVDIHLSGERYLYVIIYIFQVHVPSLYFMIDHNYFRSEETYAGIVSLASLLR